MVQPQRLNQPPQRPDNTVQRESLGITPEAISLTAHKHIKTYLAEQNQTQLNQEELNAVLRLSQHLRVFGLLSAVGYINQTKAEEGKVRQRTVPVWRCLIKGLLELPPETNTKELMTRVVNLAQNQPSEYLVMWRQSLVMSNHWNFWARAYATQE